jgi:hypothetical protein
MNKASKSAAKPAPNPIKIYMVLESLVLRLITSNPWINWNTLLFFRFNS